MLDFNPNVIKTTWLSTFMVIRFIWHWVLFRDCLIFPWKFLGNRQFIKYILICSVKTPIFSQCWILLLLSLCLLSHSVMSDLFVILWTVALQAPLSVGFPRQEYWWSGLPIPTPGDLPDPGIEPHLLHWQADSLPLSHLGSPYLAYTASKLSLW